MGSEEEKMNNSKHGLSLVELIAVLVMVAIVSAFMIPLGTMKDLERNNITEQIVQEKGVFPNKTVLRAVVGATLSIDGLETGLVTETHDHYYSYIEIITADHVKPGAWDKALRAKLLYFDGDKGWLVPMKSVVVPTLGNE